MKIEGSVEGFTKALQHSHEFTGSAFRDLVEDTNEEVAFKITSMYGQTIRESIPLLKIALQNLDSDSAWKICHKLAGTAQVIGFIKFGKDSRALNEKIKADGLTTELQQECLHFIERCEHLSRELDEAFIFINYRS